MSAIACKIIGDGKLDSSVKLPAEFSHIVAKEIISDIMDNAMDIVDLGKIEIKDKPDVSTKSALLIGTGDQRSDEALEQQEPIPYQPPVEKKNRLTDLVRNSKQVLARIIMSDSRTAINLNKKDNEKVLEVIELDCVKASDIPFICKKKSTTSHTNLTCLEESMEEVGLGPTEKELAETVNRRMTFPRSSSSNAKAAFVARCRTLKREAVCLKKKKWDVGGKLAKLFKRRNSGETKDEFKQENE